MKVHTFEQRSAEWWEEKYGRPSPSNFDKILTPTGKISSQQMDYACQLVAETLAPPMPRYFIKEYESLAMARGTASEPAARAWYSFETGNEVKEVGLCVSDCDRYCCSPDGLLVGKECGLEMKCPLPHTHVRYLFDGGLPAKYGPQVHGSMVVTGYDEWDFMSYCEGFPPLLLTIKRDDYTKLLEEELEKFYELYQKILGKVREDRQELVAASVPPIDPENHDSIW